MNVIEVQENLKDFSEEQLISEMQNPSGFAPQFLVLSEIQRRKRMRDSYNQAKAAQQPTVAQEVVNAAGVPQGGVMDMAQAMAPKSSMEQNTGVMSMYGGGLIEKQIGGDFALSLPSGARQAAERRRSLERRIQRLAEEEMRNMNPGLVGPALASRRISRPEYEEFYSDPNMPGYTDTIPGRIFDAEIEERKRIGQEAAALGADIPSVMQLTDEEVQMAGLRGAEQAASDPENYKRLASSALDAIVDTGKSAAQNVYDAIYGFGYDNQEAIDRGVAAAGAAGRAIQQGAETAYGSIREGLTNRELSAPQEGDTVLQRAGRDALGGIQSLASGIYDVAASPFRGAEEIGRYLGSSADAPEVPDAFIALDQAMARRGVRQDMERQLEMAQAVQSGAMTAEEANEALAMGVKPPVATPTGTASAADKTAGVIEVDPAAVPDAAPVTQIPAVPGRPGSEVTVTPLEERLVQMEEDRAKALEANKYIALAQAGLTLMGSNKPTFGEAVSEAGLAGLKAMQGAKAQYDKDVISLLNARAKVQQAQQKRVTDPLEYLKLAQQSERRAIDIQKILSGTEGSLMSEEQRQQLMQELIDVKNEARQYRLFGGGARVDRRVS